MLEVLFTQCPNAAEISSSLSPAFFQSLAVAFRRWYGQTLNFSLGHSFCPADDSAARQLVLFSMSTTVSILCVSGAIFLQAS
ncbi:hypothetical protein CAZ19_01925 [Pseudomonas aeruginosa]|nr:hypothetical protein AO884_06315 [Pseudomonas aeruginosa]KSF07625.1 hypothetical protein AO930_08015 [Pseudomonas aeruginosa]KSN25443.1 hypothetical protein APA83_00635 [Pseudomonas aeruginosa]KSO90323.1 hypothetical protein APB00_06455 [Pseudomonas aeruginosa]KSP24155.1 hypothetical protein APB10_13505 [Pseudomonas aeruginosa]